MKKRVLSLLIALCFVIGLIPAVSAETIASGTCGENLTWRYEETIDYAWGLIYGTLYIEGEGAMDDYMLDENGMSTAPWRNRGFHKIVVGPGVTYIGEYAFHGNCPSSIILYKTDVTGIGSHALASDEYCEKVVLPAGLTTITDGLFLNDSMLRQVYIPEGVVSIGSDSFSGTAITDLNIPKTVTTVGGNAFEGMPGPIWFSGDVPSFAADTFTGYSGTVYYPADDPSWAEAAGNADGSATWVPAPLYSGTCGDDLTWRMEYGTLYIDGEGSMYDYDSSDAPWSELTFDTLEIGPGVTSIGNDAFWWCKKLLFTNLGESHVQRIGTSAFGYTGIFQETVPEGVTVLENGVFTGTASLETISLPESLVTIENAAFYNSGLKELTIPRNVRSMGGVVFYYVRGAVIRFTGDAPVLSKATGEDDDTFDTFDSFQGTIYYPGNNPTWTEDIVEENSKWRTWIPYILNPFNDVPEDSFYHDPVMWAIEKGITNGLTATEFGPTATCNRAQVVTFLWRAAGCPEPTSAANPFVDVQAGSFYEKPVLWAVEKGITNGSDATHFGPTGVCNRAQVVTFLYRAFESPAVSTEGLPFTDVPAGAWYEAPIAWAVENGVTNGLSATEFGPNASCNRAQVVTFLYRAYNG